MPGSSSPLQEICALIGSPVAGNPTQYVVERAFYHHGLDWRYLSLEVAPDDLEAAVRGMRAIGLRGGNVTLPHKTAIVPLLDRLSDAASLMGAVNCWVRIGREFRGENTDGKGFLQSLAGTFDVPGKRVVFLGAGGAARAIAIELALAGAASITIANRTPDRGRELAELIASKTKTAASSLPWEGDFQVPDGTDLVVQATSIGLNDPQAGVPIALESLRPSMVLADVIPNPPNTWLLRQARARGLKTIDGLGMLVNQAAIGFKIWTGVEPDRGVMREALEEYLEV